MKLTDLRNYNIITRYNLNLALKYITEGIELCLVCVAGASRSEASGLVPDGARLRESRPLSKRPPASGA